MGAPKSSSKLGTAQLNPPDMLQILGISQLMQSAAAVGSMAFEFKTLAKNRDKAITTMGFYHTLVEMDAFDKPS